MNFTEVVNEVITTTKRPTLINTIRRKVNGAINFYSLDCDFSRDLYEQLVSIDAAEYTQSVALSTLTRFRKFKYIKRAGTNRHLKLLSDCELFSTCDKRGRYYIAGSVVNLYMDTLASSLDVGFYQYPPVLTDAVTNRTHWMLDVNPFMIIERACADIFRDIGDEKSMQIAMIAARDYYLAFRADQGVATQ